jgi:hypothetical protein
MGLGLLLLVSVGKENLYLSAQPEITYFKIAYKRHTNYSTEPTPQYFKTTPDFGRRCTVNISKNADLMGPIYLYVELPDIINETSVTLPRNIKNFSWSKKIGLALINLIELEIGGVTIERHYADWMNIWLELTTNKGLQSGYDKMIGNFSELTTLTNGKNGYILYIPLVFWFCQESGLALPLLSLIHSDVKIHVEFNDISSCYNQSPTNYIQVQENYSLFQNNELIIQNINNNIAIGRFVYYDNINKRLYYSVVKGKFSIPTIVNDAKYIIMGQESKYTVNISINTYSVMDDDYFRYTSPSLTNAYLLVTYIFLDNMERMQFIKNKHEYLVPIVDTLGNQVVNSSNIKYKLSFYNPSKLLIWRCILLFNYQINDFFNYTSLPYTTNSEELITNHKLIINSIERMPLYGYEHYTYLPKYEYKFSTRQNGIYIYSFGINPKNFQPSGTLNFSKVTDAYLQLTMNKNINYQNPGLLQAYSLYYNLFKIEYGIGGLEFNS